MSTPADIAIPAGRGPSLIYTYPDGHDTTSVVLVDRIAVDNPRERAICRALLLHALTLLDAAEISERLDLGLATIPARP